jgi:hypothetical protein
VEVFQYEVIQLVLTAEFLENLVLLLRVCRFVDLIATANFKNRVSKCKKKKKQENKYNKIEIKHIICVFYFGIVMKLLCNPVSFIFNHENIKG